MGYHEKAMDQEDRIRLHKLLCVTSGKEIAPKDLVGPLPPQEEIDRITRELRQHCAERVRTILECQRIGPEDLAVRVGSQS